MLLHHFYFLYLLSVCSRSVSLYARSASLFTIHLIILWVDKLCFFMCIFTQKLCEVIRWAIGSSIMLWWRKWTRKILMQIIILLIGWGRQILRIFPNASACKWLFGRNQTWILRTIWLRSLSFGEVSCILFLNRFTLLVWSCSYYKFYLLLLIIDWVVTWVSIWKPSRGSERWL